MTRIDKIQQKLTEHTLDAILVSTPANIFYLTGLPFLAAMDREGFLLITKNSRYVISSPLYKDEFIQKAPGFTFLEISSVLKKSFTEYLREVSQKESLHTIGFEGENITYNEYQRIVSELANGTLKNVDISDIREIKDEEEITYIREACSISDTVFEKVLHILKEGITEKEVASYMAQLIHDLGADLSFPTIVAFGGNAATPHHMTDDTKLKKNQFVLFDFGAKVHEYCSDVSRTVYFGTPSEQEVSYYNTLLESQIRAIQYASTAHPVIGGRIEQVARDYLKEQGLAPFMHSGHGMGINDHELPSIRPSSQEIITEGMVFTIEPGFYISGELGIRIEDDILKTKNGLEILTHAPKELITI